MTTIEGRSLQMPRVSQRAVPACSRLCAIVRKCFIFPSKIFTVYSQYIILLKYVKYKKRCFGAKTRDYILKGLSYSLSSDRSWGAKIVKYTHRDNEGVKLK